MTKLTRRAFAASAAAAAAGISLGQARIRASLSEPPRHRGRAMGRGRRHRRDRAHRRGAAGEGPRPAVQRGEPHRRLRRGRPFGDRDRRSPTATPSACSRSKSRMMHWQGLTELEPEELHAARADERGPARHPGERDSPYKTIKELADAIKAAPRRQAEGLRHRPGRHLASRAGRLAQGDGPRGQSRRLGAVERRRARDAGSRGRRPRSHAPARCPRRARSSRPARRARSPSWRRSATPLFPDIPTLKEAAGIDYSVGAWRGIAGPKGLPRRRRRRNSPRR